MRTENKSSGPALPGLGWICPNCGQRLATADRKATCPRCDFRIELKNGVWMFAPGFRPPGFSASRREHLASLELEHFWFPPRRRLLSRLVDRLTIDPSKDEALELGCGTGRFLPVLGARFAAVFAVDGYKASLAQAREALPSATFLQADILSLPFESERFRLAVALDVLEHVDAEPFLRSAARVVQKGGWLLLSVPAHPRLWSAMDVAAGHRCRYSRPSLRAELAATGWSIVHWTHYQFILLPAMWLGRRLSGSALARVERHPPALLSRLLGAVNRCEVALLSRFKLPWGSSLIVIARKML